MVEELISLGAVFLAVLIAPVISKRTGLPVIVLEVSLGILLGKSFLDVIVYESWLDFLADFGLIYLLFLVGIEVGVRRPSSRGLLMAAFSLVPSFALGYLTGHAIGVDPFLLGTLLCTTSIGAVAPVLRETPINRALRRFILESLLVVDAFSMVLLAVALGVGAGTPPYMLVLSILLAFSMFLIPIAFKKFRIGRRIAEWSKDKTHLEYEVRMCIALVVFFALIFELFGFHGMLGAFLAGLIVSEITERGSALEKRLVSFGYGFFIPIFFIVVGAAANVWVLVELESLLLLLLFVVVAFSGKVLGMVIAGKLLGYAGKVSAAIGVLHATTLTIILAGAKVGLEMNLLSEVVYSAILVFALITVPVSYTHLTLPTTERV